MNVDDLLAWMRTPRGLVASLILVLLFAGLPVISVVLASAIADALGCRLNEGDAHPCLFHGVDLGNLLYDMFVAGWLGLLTIPIGVALLLAWLFGVVMLVLKSMRARNPSQPF